MKSRRSLLKYFKVFQGKNEYWHLQISGILLNGHRNRASANVLIGLGLLRYFPVCKTENLVTIEKIKIGMDFWNRDDLCSTRHKQYRKQIYLCAVVCNHGNSHHTFTKRIITGDDMWICEFARQTRQRVSDIKEKTKSKTKSLFKGTQKKSEHLSLFFWHSRLDP